MLDALSGSLGMVLKRPFALVPIFIMMLALALVSVFFQLEMIEFVDFMSTSEAPLSNPIHAISYFLSTNPKGLFYIFGYAFLGLAAFLLISIYYCRLIVTKDKKGSIMSALAFAFGSLWNIIVLLGTMLLFFVSAFVALFVITLLLISNIYLYVAIMFLFMLIFLVLYIRLFAFVIPALAEEKTNTKNALKKNWGFVNKHFWATLLLFFVLLLVILLTGLLYNAAVEPFEDNITVFSIFAFFGTFNAAYCLGTMAIYYSKHER